MQTQKIDRKLYPELNLLLWDNANRFITEQEAFQTYETRWRYVIESNLIPAERKLIRHLTRVIGKEMFLAA